ncbi:MAG: SGNH/GDSL hydrolase family protein [Armatimonadetes bacterium]|nr:SGNH/GDSL hydrolase family protein [Armatimonadota bacterium]
MSDSNRVGLAGRLRGCAANLAVLTFGLLLALGLGELLVRLLVGNPPDLLDKSDPVLGARFHRNAVAERRIDGRRIPIRINSLGFHSPEHPFARQPGVRRLLFLGDSFTGATEVVLPETFHQRAAGLLSRGGLRCEAVSLGVSGYNTVQELLVYRELGRRYQPDAVVLAVFVGNDVSDNHPRLSGANLPFYALDPGGALRPLPFRPRWTRNRSWLRDSALYKWQKVVTNEFFSGFLKAQNILPRYGVYRPPTEAVWREAWEVTEALLRAVRDAARAEGQPLLLLLLPEQIQVEQTAWSAMLERYPKMAAERWDLGYPQRRLADFARRERIEVLDVQEAFRAAPASLYNRQEPHLNPAGHALLAELVAKRLNQLGWLAPDASRR